MTGSAKNYVFTVNNYEALLDPALWPGCLYCVYQEEVGEAGTPHLQGYLCFDARLTRARVSSLPGLERAHLETARGTPDQNVGYCTKEDGRLGGPYEFGVRPKGQGARKDLEEVAAKIKSGVSLKRIAEEHPSDFIRYSTGFKAIQAYTAPRRGAYDKTICFVFYGAGGTGKSTFARRLAHFLSSDEGASGDVFSLPPAKGSGQYWDGYNQGDVVIIDEMKGDRMKPTEFNQLIDSGEMCVPVHGGQVQFNSRYVIITTNVTPSEWWPNTKYKHSLRRRIIVWPIFRRFDIDVKSSRSTLVYDSRTGVFISRSANLVSQ